MLPRPAVPRNGLLAALSAADLNRLAPRLDRVALEYGEVLQEANRPARFAFFPEQGAASLLSSTRDALPVEVALVGRSGMVGIPFLLGSTNSPFRTAVQIPGEALRIGADDLRRAFSHSSALQRVVLFYVHALLVQTSQLVLCNARHPIEKRVARWLLLAHDCQDSDEVPVTHDAMSRSLAVRRASVTEALTRLQDAAVVRTARGCLTISDRHRLEQMACGCYGVIKYEHDGIASLGSRGGPSEGVSSRSEVDSG